MFKRGHLMTCQVLLVPGAWERFWRMSQTLVWFDLRVCRIRVYYIWSELSEKEKKDNITLTKLYTWCCFTFFYLFRGFAYSWDEHYRVISFTVLPYCVRLYSLLTRLVSLSTRRCLCCHWEKKNWACSVSLTLCPWNIKDRNENSC